MDQGNVVSQEPESTPSGRDAVGEATLEMFASNQGYNEFLWRRLSALSPPRGRILEVGCGIGNLTRCILAEPQVTNVHGIDMDPAYVKRVLGTIDDPRFDASCSTAEDFLLPTHPAAADAGYDGIVCSNVLEHIEDHIGAMRNFRRLLAPGGRALILVPAHRWLYCDLDRNLSHYRRYAPADIHEVGVQSGLALERYRHFNPLGIIGWWINGKVLRRKVLPIDQVRLYSRFAISISSLLDRLNPFPLGISLLAVYRKD